ncbi:MAG: glycosyltransferase family A protein [Terriglobales bacterium]
MVKPKPFETLLERRHTESVVQTSVAISCFNHGTEGGEALSSLLRQTEESINVVLIDDHSTDDSVDLLLHWFETNPWQHKFKNVLFVRHLENQGLTHARNTALSLVTTPYIFILDADNQLYPRALRVLREALENSGYAMAYSLLEKFGDETGIMGNSVWIPEKFSYYNYIDAMTLIRTEVLRQIGGYRVMPNKFGWEDYDLWCTFVDMGLRGCHVPQILCRYRVQSSSMVRTITQSFITNEIAMVREDFERHHNHPFYF